MQTKIIAFLLLILLFSVQAVDETSIFGKDFLYEEEEYAFCKKFLAAGQPEKAINAYQQMLKDYPKTKYQPEIYFMMGYTYNNNLNDTAKAGVIYRNLIKKFPKSEFAPSAKFELEHLGQPDFLPEFDNLK